MNNGPELEHADEAWLTAAIERGTTEQGRTDLRAEAETAAIEDDSARATALRVAAERGRVREVRRGDAMRLAVAQRPRTLQHADVEHVRNEFGVADEQIRRDHAISRILAALSAMPNSDDLIFFGGTALSRSYLPTLRLSEDIDLITTTDRRTTARTVEAAITRALGRSHGVVDWQPRLADVAEAEPAVLSTATGVTVRVQLLNAAGYPPWPTQKVQLIQRYQDVDPAELTTYSPQGFAASKLNAWLDRHAARDLYDMWALGEHGWIDREAAGLFTQHGLTGGPPQGWMFDRGITTEQWAGALAHQGRTATDSATALAAVRTRWLEAATSAA